MKELLQKYNIRAPRYTSYPPATEFHGEGFSKDEVSGILHSSNMGYPENISLYIHFPYCPQRCHFCGCNSYLERSPEKSTEYIDAVAREIELVFNHLDLHRPVTQIHWGGGTPNSLDMKQIGRIMDLLNKNVNLAGEAEIAMECNPAYLGPQDIKSLKAMGFNRLSLGIQDFDPLVLKAVNRAQSSITIEELVEQIRSVGFEGINFDFIYGLPLQSRESFIRNLERAVKIKPERLVTFSYAHVPWVKEEQKVLENLKFPDADDKLDMLLSGMDYMTSSGYVMVGMDHYALPGDSLGKATSSGQLHRNFQGYCTRETTGQVYAFGASAISQLDRAYLQNIKNPDEYIRSVNNKKHAIVRGYELSEQQYLIRAVITELMCNGIVDFTEIGKQFHMSSADVRSIFKYNPSDFTAAEADGLLKAEANRIELMVPGKLLSRYIAYKLDPEKVEGAKGYSSVI